MSDAEWTALVGVLALIIAVAAYNVMKGRDPKPMTAPGEAEQPAVDPMLCKFAHHEGDVVGETVAIEDGRLILKQAGVFKSVPVAMASMAGDEVRLSGAIDWDSAKQAGAAWLEANRAGHDTGISDRLTRSDEVRAPALEAFQRHQADLEEE